MKEGNAHYGEKEKRALKGQPYQIMITIFFMAVLAVILCFLFRGSSSGDPIVINPTDRQPDTATAGQAAEASSGTGNLPAPASDPDWNLTLVNRWNPLPENYPVTLVEVPGGERVDERIYEPLMEMLEAAREDNWDQLPKVVSGYRTQEKQQELYDEKIAEYTRQGYSVEEAEQWVAIPGHSEHQLGIAVDINGATYDLYFWLQENSYKYGFIFRYPAGKTDITGIAEEVWHYRYVGVEAATEMYEQGLCLEEYLDKAEASQ